MTTTQFLTAMNMFNLELPTELLLVFLAVLGIICVGTALSLFFTR